MGKLLDLFSKITYKGDKINLDSTIVSLRSLIPGNDVSLPKKKDLSKE
jgi:hypothetical protein